MIGHWFHSVWSQSVTQTRCGVAETSQWRRSVSSGAVRPSSGIVDFKGCVLLLLLHLLFEKPLTFCRRRLNPEIEFSNSLRGLWKCVIIVCLFASNATKLSQFSMRWTAGALSSRPGGFPQADSSVPFTLLSFFKVYVLSFSVELKSWIRVVCRPTGRLVLSQTFDACRILYKQVFQATHRV